MHAWDERGEGEAEHLLCRRLADAACDGDDAGIGGETRACGAADVFQGAKRIARADQRAITGIGHVAFIDDGGGSAPGESGGDEVVTVALVFEGDEDIPGSRVRVSMEKR